MMERDHARPPRWQRFRESLEADRQRAEQQANGWAGAIWLLIVTGFVLGFGWIEFYGNGLRPASFLYRNWPLEPELGTHYRWAGWGFLGFGALTFLGTLWAAGREGMSFVRFFQSVWVAGIIALIGMFWLALGFQYDRWFVIHGEMTQDEIRAAPAWTEPGLPPLDELF